MASGLFYRSDDLSNCSDVDITSLRQLSLRTVIDLRMASERKNRSNRLPERLGVQVFHVPIRYHQQEFGYWKMFRTLFSIQGRQIDLHAFIHEIYHCIVFDEAKQIGAVLDLLSDDKNLPVVIHCAAGKDRTGVVAALLQLLAGVSYQTMMDDYLASNRVVQKEDKKLVGQLRWMSLFSLSVEQMQPLLQVHPAHLESVLSEMLDRYGALDGYLRDACGATPDRILHLQRRLLGV